MSTKEKGRFMFAGFILTVCLGVGAIAVAVHLGKAWDASQFAQEIGVALLVVALIELLLLRVLRELSARKTELDRLSEDLRESSERHKQQLQELQQNLNSIKLDNIFTTIHKMDQIIDIKLEQILCKVDPDYARVVEAATSQQKP